MTRLALCLCVSVVILASFAQAQSCPATEWCQIYSAAPDDGSGFHDNAWNVLEYVKDTGKFYLFASNKGGITPESNAFWSLTTVNSPTANPYTKVSSCGDELATQRNGMNYHLVESITSGETTRLHIALDSGTAGLTRVEEINYPNGGTANVGNESIHYAKCTTTDNINGTVCPSSPPFAVGPDFYLWTLRRGTRQTAGWSAASAHTGSTTVANAERVGFGCFNPALGNSWSPDGDPSNPSTFDLGTKRDGNGDSLWDHPPARHVVDHVTYDSFRGRLWDSFGFEENAKLTDTWSLCLKDKSGPAGGDALSKCAAADVYTAASTTRGWQRISATGPLFTLYDDWHAENSSIYDPSVDAIIEMGGMDSATATHMHIFCMSATGGPEGFAFGCDASKAGTWVLLTANTTAGAACGPGSGTTKYCGNPGKRDGLRAIYFDDAASATPKPRILWFGGWAVGSGTPGFNFDSVAQYDASAGQFCLSHDSTGHGEFNAATCSLPAESGATPKAVVNHTTSTCSTPPCANRVLKFPDWTWDTAQQKGLWYGGPASLDGGGFYAYEPNLNQWAALTVTSTNWPSANDAFKSHSSMGYDETNQVVVWLQGGSNPDAQLWQIPEAAFGSTPPPTGTATKYSGMKISGVKIQ